VVRVWTAKTGQFGSRPVQKPNLMTFARPNPDPYLSTHGFPRVWLYPSVSTSCSVFLISHLWSYSNMHLLIIKYRDWYVKVHFRLIGRLNHQNEQTHTPYLILKICVNGVPMFVGCVSWVIWGCARLNTVINKVLATFIAKKAREMLPTASSK